MAAQPACCSKQVSRRFSFVPPQSVPTSVPLTQEEWTVISASLGLTTRESQIARLVLDDVSKTQMAAQLSISPCTVNAHFANLRTKLGIHSRDQLVLRLFSAYLSSCAKRTPGFE
jgi:DNA-binding NarL/FixJ family response regulator